MNNNTKYIIIGCILLVMLITMGTSCGAVPYSAMTIPHSIVEGATPLHETNTKTNTKQNFNYNLQLLINELEDMIKPYLYTNLRKYLQPIKQLINQEEINLIVTRDKLTDLQKKYDNKTLLKKKIQDFIDQYLNPLINQMNPYVLQQGFTTMSDVEPMIDIYSSAVGDLDCVKTASGLSNSKGPLCLSKEQLYMLQSRGENSSGLDSQIW